jgi:hypothetical protein
MTVRKLIPMRGMTLYHASNTFNLGDYLGFDIAKNNAIFKFKCFEPDIISRPMFVLG